MTRTRPTAPSIGPAPTLTNSTLQRRSFAISTHLNRLYGPQSEKAERVGHQPRPRDDQHVGSLELPERAGVLPKLCADPDESHRHPSGQGNVAIPDPGSPGRDRNRFDPVSRDDSFGVSCRCSGTRSPGRESASAKGSRAACSRSRSSAIPKWPKKLTFRGLCVDRTREPPGGSTQPRARRRCRVDAPRSAERTRRPPSCAKTKRQSLGRNAIRG